LLLVEGLNLFPEPFDHLVFGAKLALVLSVVTPVPHVDVRHAVEDHLQLVGLEDAYQVLRDHLGKPLADGL